LGVCGSNNDEDLPSGTLNDDGVHGFTTDDLAVGEHTITVVVADEQGDACTDSIVVVIQLGEAPQVEIQVPLDDGFYYVDRPLTLRALATDEEDAPQDLLLRWAITDGPGVAEGLVPDANSFSEIEREFEIGEHELVVTVVDSHGNLGTDSVTVTVGGPNQPPRCSWVAPLDGDSVPLGVDLELWGDATDPNVPSSLLTASFSSDVDGPLAELVPDDSGNAEATIPSLTAGTHVLTLHVEDELEVPCEASITILVDRPPTAAITVPTTSTELSDNLTVILGGTVSDLEDAPEALTIRWLSDGVEIASLPADSTGLLGDEASPLSRGVHLITLEVTDSAGGVVTDTVSVDVNGEPDAPVVELSPSVPTTLDDLVSSITVEATDPDGDQLTYDYTWLIDNVEDPNLTEATVHHTETATPQVWIVEVRANDGQTLGPPGTATVWIDNTPPIGGAATVSPGLGTTATTYSLTTTGWFDADGQPEDYLYQWQVDSVAVTGATGATFVPGAAAVPGDRIDCLLTPWDGTDIGIPFQSSASFINFAASAGGVTIGPGTAYETTTLTSTVTGVSDPEGETTTVLYQWYLSPGPVPIPGAAGPSLTGADFNHFDSVQLGVSVDDGTEVGPEILSNVVPILNTLPTTTQPTIQPSILYTDTQAICVPQPIVDPDADTLTETYSWTVNTVPVTGQTTAVLDGTQFFDKTHTVRCIVIPYDQIAQGSPETSLGKIVQNTIPSAPVVEITPGVPGVADPLSCATSTPSLDADPTDTISYQRTWTLNGGSTAYTAQTLLPSVTSLNQTWTCTMIPYDGQATGPSGSDTVTLLPSQILDPGVAGNTYSQQTQTRGMWFTAPANFTITGLFVPDDTNGTEFQNVQVVLLPASFGTGSSTSAGTTLLYERQQPANTVITTNIPVLAGEKIGFLGARGTSTMNSMYSPGNAPVASTLDGAAIQLFRLEYEDNLWNTAAGTLIDATGPIGRVEVEYIP
jgi:hypothetical protein